MLAIKGLLGDSAELYVVHDHYDLLKQCYLCHCVGHHEDGCPDESDWWQLEPVTVPDMAALEYAAIRANPQGYFGL